MTDNHPAAITTAALGKRYAGDVAAVEQVSLTIEASEVVVLLGPSGCGKTTLLRLLAGLERPDSGVITLHGQIVAGADRWLPPERRRVGLVFQDGALFPHLTVASNVAFGLDGLTQLRRRQRISELLALVGLEGFGNRYPHQLSGGQQQRLALARALAASPRVLLLDEPFANLDATLRQSVRGEVLRIARDAGITTVMVTHDQQEALSSADRIALMFNGRVVQCASARAIYLNPVNREAALFVGEANLLVGEARGGECHCALGRLPLAHAATGPVEVMIRPEQLLPEADTAGAGRVERVIFYGHDQVAHIAWPGGTHLRARTPPTLALTSGMAVNLRIQGPVWAFPLPVGR